MDFPRKIFDARYGWPFSREYVFFFLSFFFWEGTRIALRSNWTVDIGTVEEICWKMISGTIGRVEKEGLEATSVEKLRRNGKIRLCVNYTEFFP